MEEVIVDERACCMLLFLRVASLFPLFFAASGLRTVPHESGSGIATPCLETRWYGLEIMSVKERVKRCTHAQIFCALKRRLGLAERSCYSIRTWTAANGRQRELEIMRVRYTAQCLRSNYLWSLLMSCQNPADDIWLPACLRERGLSFAPSRSNKPSPSASEIINVAAFQTSSFQLLLSSLLTI